VLCGYDAKDGQALLDLYLAATGCKDKDGRPTAKLVRATEFKDLSQRISRWTADHDAWTRLDGGPPKTKQEEVFD